MDTEGKQKVLTQTDIDNFEKQGFPPGSLDNSRMHGIGFKKLPFYFTVRNARLEGCKFQDMTSGIIDLSECMLTDCVFARLRLVGLVLKEAGILGTLFSELFLHELDLNRADLKISSIRDCSIDHMVVRQATVEDSYFYNVDMQKIEGVETLNMGAGVCFS